MSETISIIAGLVEEFGPLIILIIAVILIQYRDKEHYKRILKEDHKDLEDAINKRTNRVEKSVNSMHSQLIIITSALINLNGDYDSDMLNNYLFDVMNTSRNMNENENEQQSEEVE